MSNLDAEIEIVRNGAATPNEVLARAPRGLVLSPGPETPQDIGITIELIGAAAPPSRAETRCSRTSVGRVHHAGLGIAEPRQAEQVRRFRLTRTGMTSSARSARPRH